jgi:hypothetical protein
MNPPSEGKTGEIMEDEWPGLWALRQDLRQQAGESLEAYRERQKKILEELDERERAYKRMHGEGFTEWIPDPGLDDHKEK